MDGETLQQKINHKLRKNSKRQDLQRQEGGGNAFGILGSQFQVLLGIMEQRLMVVRDIVFMCVVMYNMLRKLQDGADRAPTPANDVAVLQHEQVVYVPHDNYRNHSR